MREWNEFKQQLDSVLAMNSNTIKSLSIDGQAIRRVSEFTTAPDFRLASQNAPILPYIGGFQFSVDAFEDSGVKISSLSFFLSKEEVIILTNGTDNKRVCKYQDFGTSFKIAYLSSTTTLEDLEKPETIHLKMTIAFSVPDLITFDPHFPTAAVTYLRLEI